MICTRSDGNVINLKILESFYNGLSDRTELEMGRLNIHNINEMYQIIDATENTMIKQMNNLNQNKKAVREERRERKVKNKYSKLCEYHKLNSHNTNECRARTTNLSHKNDKRDRDKNAYSFTVPKVDIQSLELVTQLKKEPLGQSLIMPQHTVL